MSMPAARIGDMHVCPMVTPGVPPIPHVGGPISMGAPTVLTCMMPQARVSDMCVCVGPPDVIAMGSPTVLVCGMPAARIGDTTAHGGAIMTGAPTVLIGMAGGGGGSGGGGGGFGGAAGAAKSGGASGSATGTESEGVAGDKLKNRSGSPLVSTGAGMANPSQQAATLRQASEDGAPFCEACAAAAQNEAAKTGARAATSGSGSASGGGSGADLPAHEATHTLQQSGGSGPASGTR